MKTGIGHTLKKTDASELVSALHALSPLRVWSLIVTIFGDIVMRQGRDGSPAPVWTGSIQAVLDLLSIDPGLTRTSLSRLVSNGLLVREKSGRNSFYKLSLQSRKDFKQASHIIYGRDIREPTGRFHLALLDQCRDRPAARERLGALGFRFMSPTTGLLPEHRGKEVGGLPSDVVQGIALPSSVLHDAAISAWSIDDLDEDYTQFCAIAAGCPRRDGLKPADAVAARVVLVHLFRRLVLRDPVLPQAALPRDWAGQRARGLFAKCLEIVTPVSEQWLADQQIRQPKARTGA